jgi:hypothetical protein
MVFKDLDKNEVVDKAQRYFLEEFPLREIDNQSVRLICQSYRNENSSLDSCKHLFKNHFNYFYNWAYTNWMTNVFYGKRE